MANLKNITELPVAESAEGLNLIVNDNGAAKQIAASAVGAQADWNVEDATSPSYILNKPEIPAAQVQADWAETDETSAAYIKNKPDYDAVINLSGSFTIANASLVSGSYEACMEKLLALELPKIAITACYDDDGMVYKRSDAVGANAYENSEIYFCWINDGYVYKMSLNSDGSLSNLYRATLSWVAAS